jgi:hypothetical protein
MLSISEKQSYSVDFFLVEPYSTELACDKCCILLKKESGDKTKIPDNR